MKHQYFINILFAICFMQLTCNNSYSPNEKWGLKSVELEKEIELKGEAYKHEIEYVPLISSTKFEFRLYYPNLNYHDYDYDKKKRIRLDIIESLNSFRFELFDAEIKQKINDYVVLTPGTKGFSFSFNENSPISLWIKSKTNLQAGKKYLIQLSIPPKGDANAAYLKPIFVIGIAYDTFL